MGFGDSGGFVSRIARITGELTEKLYSDYDAKLLGDKEELENICRYSVKKYPSGCYSNVELEVQHRVRAKIKDLLETDYKHFEKFIPKSVWAAASDDEIEALLKFMLRIRISPIDVDAFFREASDASNELHRLNSHIKSGKLIYNYEELYVQLLNKWNENNKNTADITVTDLFTDIDLIGELRLTTKYFADAIRSKDYIRMHTEKQNLTSLYGRILDKVQELEKASELQNENKSAIVEPVLFKVIIYLEELAGSNRGILMAMVDVTNEYKGNEIVDYYIKSFNESIELMNSKNRTQYSLFESYLLVIIMYSLFNERQVWIKIQKFLRKEIDDDVKPVKNPTVKQEDAYQKIQDVIEWYGGERIMPLDLNEEMLRNGIYKELYCYNKKRPKDLKRSGTNDILSYIGKKENIDVDNLPYKEMFYYEKILRGIYREYNQIERYGIQKLCMNKVYKMESALYSVENISRICLGGWVNAYTDAILNTMIKYFELFYKMPL